MKKIILTILFIILIALIAIYIVMLANKASNKSSKATTSILTSNVSSDSSNPISSSEPITSSQITSDNINSNISSSKLESKPDTSSMPVSSQTSSKIQSSEPALSNSDEPLPPVSKELQKQYLKALEMYKWFYSGAIYSDKCHITKDGTKVPDTRFKDYGSFYNYLLSIFSNCYIEERLLSSNYFNSNNGMPEDFSQKLERINSYQEHSFELKSKSNDKIEIRVIVTFNSDGKTYKADYPLIFENECGIWTISDFYLWYAPDGVDDNCILPA